MAKARKSKPADATQDSEKFAENHQPEVLSRLERLHAELAKETGDASGLGGNIHDQFTTEALSQFAELIALISKNENLPRQERLEAIRRIRDLASDEAEKLEPKIPKKAPALWVDRDRSKNEHPFVFAHRVYGDAAVVMVVSDYDRLDHALGSILERYKREGRPIPEGYYIQSKAERDKDIIESSPPTWKELIANLPSDQQKRFRAWKAAQSRQSLGKNSLD